MFKNNILVNEFLRLMSSALLRHSQQLLTTATCAKTRKPSPVVTHLLLPNNDKWHGRGIHPTECPLGADNARRNN